MTQLTIRRASKEDLPAIMSLYVQAGLEQKGESNLPAATSIWERILSYPDYRIYVAIQDRELVGAFELLMMDNLAHHGSPSGIVEDVAVSPEHQRQGIGKAMMQFAMNECRQAGCYKLCLSSNLNRQAAHEFYEQLGFKKHGFSFLVHLSD